MEVILRTSSFVGDLPISQAYAVEESSDEVIFAIPTVPWWKQSRVKFLFGTVLIVVVVMAVALGLSWSSSSGDDGVPTDPAGVTLWLKGQMSHL